MCLAAALRVSFWTHVASHNHRAEKTGSDRVAAGDISSCPPPRGAPALQWVFLAVVSFVRAAANSEQHLIDPERRPRAQSWCGGESAQEVYELAHVSGGLGTKLEPSPCASEPPPRWLIEPLPGSASIVSQAAATTRLYTWAKQLWTMRSMMGVFETCDRHRAANAVSDRPQLANCVATFPP